MGIKISEYTNTGTSLSASDLTEFSKLISTGPDVWQTQKFPYSVLLTELTADLNFVEGSGTLNYVPRFTAAGTIADGSIRDNLSQIGVGASFDSSSYAYIYNTAYTFALNANNAGTSNIISRYGIYGQSIVANSGFSNGGVYGVALNSTGGNNIGVRGLSASQGVETSGDILSTPSNSSGIQVSLGGFFQANTASTTVEAYGVVGSGDASSLQTGATFIGGYFRAKNATNKYSVRLEDGSEGIGKFLKSIDAKGRANWATVNDYTADATPDSAADYFLTWDTSAGLHKKVLMSNVPSSAVTLYNSNSTFTAARTAKLSGNTSSEFLTFETLSGNDILKIKGDSSIDFGMPGVQTLKHHYGNNTGNGDSYYRYSGLSRFMGIDYTDGSLGFFNIAGNKTVNIQSYAGTNRGLIEIIGNDSFFIMYSSTTASQIQSSVSASIGGTYTKYLNNAGIVKASIEGDGMLSIGAASSGNYNVEFTGSMMQKSGNVGIYGATPVPQHSTTGTITGIIHSGGPAVGATDTFTGAVGTTAYTLSDIVKALKNIGILAQ